MNKWDKLYEKISSEIDSNDDIIENLIMSFDENKSKKITHYQVKNATLTTIKWVMENMEEDNE